MRDLDWHGYVNARDLGGLPTALSPTGATLFGRVARGPRRELLSAAGWAAARAWGLRTVVDLRCGPEIGARDGDPASGDRAGGDRASGDRASGDPASGDRASGDRASGDPASGDNAGLSIIHAPTEDHANPEFRAVCFPILDSPAYWPHNWRILPSLVREALRAIADAPAGVLVHCSAGRDRTGMISALLLGNAGVAAEAIADDYAQSVRAMAGVAAHLPTYDRQAVWSPADVEAWVSETAPMVREVAGKTDEVFEQLGVTPTERARLRDLLVAPTD